MIIYFVDDFAYADTSLFAGLLHRAESSLASSVNTLNEGKRVLLQAAHDANKEVPGHSESSTI